jgi:hypothetical protein
MPQRPAAQKSRSAAVTEICWRSGYSQRKICSGSRRFGEFVMTAGMPIRLIACLLYMAGGTAATAETRYDRCLTLVQSVNDKLNEQFPERTNTEPSAPAFTPPETDTAVPQFRVAKRVLPYSVITLTYTEHKFASKTPEVRMTKKKVGQYPEFKGFTVKWRDVYADVP